MWCVFTRSGEMAQQGARYIGPVHIEGKKQYPWRLKHAQSCWIALFMLFDADAANVAFKSRFVESNDYWRRLMRLCAAVGPLSKSDLPFIEKEETNDDVPF